MRLIANELKEQRKAAYLSRSAEGYATDATWLRRSECDRWENVKLDELFRSVSDILILWRREVMLEA